MSDELEQFKSYLSDLGNIGARHDTARSFYIAVITALIAFAALAGKDGPLKAVSHTLLTVVCLAGVLVCALWLFSALTFLALYKAKFQRINVMEKSLPFQNYAAEYEILRKDRRYTGISKIEICVSVVFVLLFIATIFLGR